MSNLFLKVHCGIRQRWVHYQGSRRWQALSRKVKEIGGRDIKVRPVVLFNASTRLAAVSQNAAYSLLTGLSLRFQGIPVIQFACHAGLSRCVLGSNRDDFSALPPCKLCIHQSQSIFKYSETVWFDYKEDSTLRTLIESLSVNKLEKFEYQGKPLGFWAVNSLRWVMRRHHLADDAHTRQFFRAFILSAWNVYSQFIELMRTANPQAVVVFNGMFYPEAAVRYACLENDIRVITHEVGLRPFTAFFTTGEATAYPMHISPESQLSEKMNRQLDDYLSNRFKGNFSMAGIRFWPEMNGLDKGFLATIGKFKKVVPVFTNVIFDTSQVHANTLFPHMFTWLEHVHSTALAHPEILFVIRAHPDESRPGKQSRESVADWVKESQVNLLPNVIFVDSDEFISSYELIQRSHLVMVYNSTIGLEATLLGKPVIAGGKARFTQLPTSFFPASQEDYKTLLEQLLSTESIEIPPEFIVNARRFLYFQLYATSLDFSQFLQEDGVWKGYVKLKSFPVETLTPQTSTTINTLLDGILHGGNFYNTL